MKREKTYTQAEAEAMFRVLNELRHAIFVKGGQPDDIMEVATKALQLVRKIQNPNFNIELPKTY